MYSVMMRLQAAICFLLPAFYLQAQKDIPPLEKEVSIKVVDEPISSVLIKITEQTGVKFSYSPATIPADRKTSLSLDQKPVRTVIRLLFGDDVLMKPKGNYIILTARKQSAAQAQIKHVMISGYVYDSKGDKLASASIVSKAEKISAVTNRYGYYKMQVPSDKLPIALKVEKENYPDTSFQVKKEAVEVDVIMPPFEKDTTKQATDADTAEFTSISDTAKVSECDFLARFLLSEETLANVRNISDTLFSNVQLSLVPFLSTNKLLVGNTENVISMNLLAGYSQGVKAVEIGGLINVNRGNVKYVQLAGWANAVSGNVDGVQVAGLANLNSGSAEGVRMAGMLNIGHHMNGMQVAGLLNINADYKSGMRNIRGFLKDTVEGVSIAGLMNVNAGYMNGVRLGGIANIGNSIDGVQVAGLFNANAGAVTEGVQLAGLFNANAEGITEGVELAGLFNINRKHMNGFQLGGLFNVTGESSDGVQLAGLFNVTIKEISGLQLSGLFNYAREMDGVQIGLINVSGGEDVFPVGLLSFSRNGYHKLELYGDEIIQTQMAFRTGVQHFHNIFSAGVDLTTRFDGLWCFGYGLGSYFNINEKWLIGGDAALQLLMDGKPLKDNYKLYSGFIGVERKFGKNFSMALGPSLKLMDADQLFMNKIVPYSMYETLSQDGISGLRMWVGGKVALRFF